MVVRIKVGAIRKSWDVPVRRMEVLDGHRRLESVGGGRAGGGATELWQIGGQAGPGAPAAGLWVGQALPAPAGENALRACREIVDSTKQKASLRRPFHSLHRVAPLRVGLPARRRELYPEAQNMCLAAMARWYCVESYKNCSTTRW